MNKNKLDKTKKSLTHNFSAGKINRRSTMFINFIRKNISVIQSNTKNNEEGD